MTKKSRIAAIVFGVVVVGALLIAATTSGLGRDDVPDDAIAIVDGEEVTQEQFDRVLEQTKLGQGITETPEVGTEEYNQLRDAAIGQLLDEAWIKGEAAENGVEASDREIEEKLQQVKDQQFKSEKEFNDFVEQSGFTDEDVNEKIELQILSDKLEQEISDDVAQVSEEEAREFYDQNKTQFEQPASRDIRVILNQDPAEVEEAKAKLEAEPTDEKWNTVAKKHSTDAATKDAGGVKAGVTKGTLEGALDAAVFDAPLNTIEGPIETPLGTYIFEVTKETPKTTQPFDEVSQQLTQQLQSQKQQEVFSAFIEDYRTQWASLTVCSDGFIIERCDNFNGPAAGTQPCTEDQAKETGCPPVVTGRSPIAPGTDSLTGGGSGAPQGPHPPGGDSALPGGAGGAIPGGAGAPGGAVPVAPTG